MNAFLPLSLAAMVIAAPLVFAHQPAGTPRLYCEPPEEWLSHDYGSPSPNGPLLEYRDGNMDDCNFDGLRPDYDRHSEFAFGGAGLLVNSGNGEPSFDPTVGAGSLYCYDEMGHHANFVTVAVDDVLFGAGAEITIAADIIDRTGIGEGCGDFESDRRATGVGTITATFPHGLDGSYAVYVAGTRGHLVTD